MALVGSQSRVRLDTAHPDLIRLFDRVAEFRDIIVSEGHRSKERQDALFAEGKSKLKWPDGKHCSTPSMAVDVVPCKEGRVPDWNAKPCRDLAHFVMEIADSLNIVVRWGGDWDMDGDETDQKFNDLVHFELI